MTWVTGVLMSIATCRDEMPAKHALRHADELRELCRLKGVKTARKKQTMVDALVSAECQEPSLYVFIMIGVRLRGAMLVIANLPH